MEGLLNTNQKISVRITIRLQKEIFTGGQTAKSSDLESEVLRVRIPLGELADVMKLVDVLDLKSKAKIKVACRFESGHPHFFK